MENSGIYKIISPTNEIYIGYSNDIKRRWSTYKTGECEKQKKLFLSFITYGTSNHLFEII